MKTTTTKTSEHHYNKPTNASTPNPCTQPQKIHDHDKHKHNSIKPTVHNPKNPFTQPQHTTFQINIFKSRPREYEQNKLSLNCGSTNWLMLQTTQ